MQAGWLLSEEVPCTVMSGGSLWNFAVLLWLDSMNKIRKLYGILDEEDWDVVTNNVEVSLVGIESGSKSVDITSCTKIISDYSNIEEGMLFSWASLTGFCRTSGASNGTKSCEHWCLLSSSSKEGGGRNIGPICVTGEGTMGTSTSGMDSTLWHTLMIEVLDLLTENEVLEESWTASAGRECMLVVDWSSNIRGHVCVGIIELKLREKTAIRGVGVALGDRFAVHVRTLCVDHSAGDGEGIQK